MRGIPAMLAFGRGGIAGLFSALILMSFSYGPLASPPFSNPPIDYPRLLVSDTQAVNHIFEDEEIQAATAIQALQFQSSQFYSGAGGRNLPTSPVSYLRVAALLLDSLAANKGRLAGIQQMLDIKIDASKAATALQAQAESYRKTDDESGAFVIIEQVNDYFSFADRFWKQVQRQSGV